MTIKLKSGKDVYANKGLISIPSRMDTAYPCLYEGYDGDIPLTRFDDETDEQLPTFTFMELLEIADIMIGRWTEFKHAVEGKYIPFKAEDGST